MLDMAAQANQDFFLILTLALSPSCARRVYAISPIHFYGHERTGGYVEMSTPRFSFMWDTKTYLFVAQLLLYNHCLLTKKRNTKIKTCRRTFFLYSV